MDTNTRGRPAVSLLLTSVAFFMVALDALVVITALPAIHAQLGGSMATLEWTVNAYGLAFAAGIVTASALGDRLGRRRLYVAGLILFSAASAACALAPTATTLIAARAVQGVGAAIVTPLSLTILTSSFPAAKRGAVVGIWGGIAGLAVAGGPFGRKTQSERAVVRARSCHIFWRPGVMGVRPMASRCEEEGARWRAWKAYLGPRPAWSSSLFTGSAPG